MKGRPDPITSKYLLGQAVRLCLEAQPPASVPGRVAAMAYALAALGPAPVDPTPLARASGVGLSGLRHALGAAGWGSLIAAADDGGYRLGPAVVEVATRLGAVTREW